VNPAKHGQGGCKIVSRIDSAYLDKRLRQSIKQGWLGSEQWYRNPEKWFALTSYNNPYKTIHSELAILRKNRDKLLREISEKALVFYGVGTGDTEAFILELVLKANKSPKVIAIDVNKTYLERFFLMVPNLLYENPQAEFSCIGFHDLFENMQPSDLKGRGAACHICLGNTVGNFDQNEIFGIFKRLSKKGDKLILGVHLASDMHKILKAYENALMTDLLLDSVKTCFPNKSPEEIKWKINGLQIEGWLGQTRLLKSKKYTIEALKKLAKEHGFQFLQEFNDGNAAIVTMERK